MTMPTLEQMLKAGVHFGHRTSRWHPKMGKFIFGELNGVHVIDLEKTQAQLEIAQKFINEVVARNGNILFVGTKAQAKKVIEEQAKACGMPYINNRWLGGFFTNFETVIKLTKTLKSLIKQRDTGELNKYTKKEQVGFTKEIAKLTDEVGGVRDLEKIPDAVFIVDIKTEMTALAEASKKKVPVIALCDTNVNPSKVDYVIPSNDDSIKGIELMVTTIANIINEAKLQIKK